MTSKEAVNLFKQYNWKVEDKEKALEILEELAERDTPKKPIINTNHEIRDEIRGHNCGVCVCRLDIPQLREVNFCPKCGQRLDWSELK